MLYDDSTRPSFSDLQFTDVSLDHAIEGVPREVELAGCQLRLDTVDSLHDVWTICLRWRIPFDAVDAGVGAVEDAGHRVEAHLAGYDAYRTLFRRS